MKAGSTYVLRAENYWMWGEGAEITGTVTLEKVLPHEAITITSERDELFVRDFISFTCKPEDGIPYIVGDITWSVSDESVLSLEYTGPGYAGFIANAPGRATVTATLENGVSASHEVVVSEYKSTVETTVPMETEPAILADLAEIYEENPDLAGWITIEGTILDYPVMHTPEDGEKYLYKNINGNFDANGLPFIEVGCSMDPESDNIIIYGHNMRSGKMFASLMNYAKKEYWEAHPTIHFSTLYEEREYEIVAAFYDRVYYKYEDCFKFYQFIDAEDEAHFEEAISYFKDNAEYDTGITAEYGDKLLTLVTCAYHEKNGRFVVVAREKSGD